MLEHCFPMYGLSLQTNLGFLLNRELQQVCVGRHQIILRFDADICITLECEYSLDGVPAEAASLFPLLGEKVASLNNSGNGSLAISFSNGCELLIVDSNQGYESYAITAPNIHIIV